MAKKKSTHHGNHANQQNSVDNKKQNPENEKTQNQVQEKPKPITRQPSMEGDQSEQMQNLKNLNGLLLKEAREKRQQVESLVKAKKALEDELARNDAEKSDESLRLDIEKDAYSVFLKNQIREIGVGIDEEKSARENEIRVLKNEVNGLLGNLENAKGSLSQVVNERDLIKIDLESWIEEANRFKEKLAQKEKEFGFESMAQMNNCKKLMIEKNERDEYIEYMKKETELVTNRFDEAVLEISHLKQEIIEIMREKEEIEKDKEEKNMKINELEREVEKLNETVLRFLKEEEVLLEKIVKMEKNYGDAKEKEHGMIMEINDLVGQKQEKERHIERLMEDKEEILGRLKVVMVDINSKEEVIERLRRMNNEAKEEISMKVDEIAELQKESGKLLNDIIVLKGSCRDEEEKNRKLVNEIGKYKNDFQRVTAERNHAQKGLDEEKKKGLNLSSKVKEMEVKIEEKVKELARLSKENEKLIKKKADLNTEIQSSMEEKELIAKNYLEAKQDVDDLQAIVQSVGAMICDNDVTSRERNLGDGNNTYAADLEAIKKAFTKKEEDYEEMKQELELMKHSVVDAHKKKSFWAAMSSATTLFAAASIAYVVRGH